MHLQFPAKSINESFARLVIIGFIAPLDPNAQELNEIKTIVSEGVTNAIIHGYEDNENGIIDMKASLEGRRLRVTIQDFGKGIEFKEIYRIRLKCMHNHSPLKNSLLFLLQLICYY